MATFLPQKVTKSNGFQSIKFVNSVVPSPCEAVSHVSIKSIFNQFYVFNMLSLFLPLFSVTVPRSSLFSPYRFKPHRRASFDPTDAVSLSSHCLAGWESSKPTVIPMPSSLDLRTSLHKSRTTLVSDTLMEIIITKYEVRLYVYKYMYSVRCTCACNFNPELLYT